MQRCHFETRALIHFSLSADAFRHWASRCCPVCIQTHLSWVCSTVLHCISRFDSKEYSLIKNIITSMASFFGFVYVSSLTLFDTSRRAVLLGAMAEQQTKQFRLEIQRWHHALYPHPPLIRSAPWHSYRPKRRTLPPALPPLYVDRSRTFWFPLLGERIWPRSHAESGDLNERQGRQQRQEEGVDDQTHSGLIFILSL